MNTLKKKTTWSRRLNKNTDSIIFDKFDFRLYWHDIKFYIAHAKMLEIVGLLKIKESKIIINELKNIEKDINKIKRNWFIKKEDAHMNIEALFIKKIESIEKKLHIGKACSNVFYTAIRLYLREKLDKIKLKITKLRTNLIKLAISESDTIMPGFAQFKIAQHPITFGHHVLAWHEMIYRDHLRLLECRQRINTFPLGLGSAALITGTTNLTSKYAIIKDLLGFDHITENYLDAVSDRDFALEFTSFSSILLMHLSRMCKEILLWTNLHFDFIEIPDYLYLCTGSSLLLSQPQHPYIPDLIRCKTGRIYGNLLNVFVLMTSQPLFTYKKDIQEEKEILFDTTETVINCIESFINFIKALKIKPQKMYLSALCNYSTATGTGFYEYLVKKKCNVHLNDDHYLALSMVSKVVFYGNTNNKKINKLKEIYMENLRQVQFYNKIDKAFLDILTLEGFVNTQSHIGGTSPNQVRSAALRATKYLKKDLLG